MGQTASQELTQEDIEELQEESKGRLTQADIESLFKRFKALDRAGKVRSRPPPAPLLPLHDLEPRLEIPSKLNAALFKR